MNTILIAVICFAFGAMFGFLLASIFAAGDRK